MAEEQLAGGLALMDRRKEVPKNGAGDKTGPAPRVDNSKTVATAHPNLGNRTSLNSELRTIGKKLLKKPNDGAAFDALVRGIVAIISANPTSRRRRRVSLARRASALLRTYCIELPTDVRQRLRAACRGQLKTLEAQLRDQVQPVCVNERVAALMLGITVGDLRDMVRDPETRRRLGYPRPLGAHLLFQRAALDPNTAAAFFEQLPNAEPWPRSSWPEDWSS